MPYWKNHGYVIKDEWYSGYRAQIRQRKTADFIGWKTDNHKFAQLFEKLVKALQTEISLELKAPKSVLKKYNERYGQLENKIWQF